MKRFAAPERGTVTVPKDRDDDRLLRRERNVPGADGKPRGKIPLLA